MTVFGCENRYDCTLLALVASIVIGVVAAFLRITAVITLTPAFLWTVFGIAVGFIAVTLLAASLAGGFGACGASALTAVFSGALGTVLTAEILLAIGFEATSVLGAVITGALLFFFSLMLASAACLVKRIASCS